MNQKNSQKDNGLGSNNCMLMIELCLVNALYTQVIPLNNEVILVTNVTKVILLCPLLFKNKRERERERKRERKRERENEREKDRERQR